MTDPESFLPAAIAIGAILLAIVVAVVVVRLARRSPRARTAALGERSRAAAAVVALDDALAELDLDLELSGALHAPDAPPALRRARMTGQHARDDAYAELRAAGAPGVHPAAIRSAARQVQRSTAAAAATVAAARHEHDDWVRAHATLGTLLAAAEARLAETRAALGDPAALTRELGRFDEVEWRDAATSADDAVRAATEAAERLAEARRLADDPGQDARPALEAAVRAARRAATDERTLEETHRLVVEAHRAVPGELTAARAALREAAKARPIMRPEAVVHLDAELAAVTAELAAVEAAAPRRPLATVRTIALLHARIDAALGDALTLQQRARSARTALPGTLAAARAAVAHAEAVLRSGGDAEARLLLADAQHDLAVARAATEVHEAVAAGRRAVRNAESAVAVGDRV